jgi:hypothetical protein
MSHDPKDFLGFFHSAAQQHGRLAQRKSIADQNDQVKTKIKGILDKIKANTKELETLKQTNPKAYESMLAMTQAMVSMAKDYIAPKDSLEKALHLPSGSSKQGMAPSARLGREGATRAVKVTTAQDGDPSSQKEHWRQVAEGQIQDPESPVTGTPISVLTAKRKGQWNEGASLQIPRRK